MSANEGGGESGKHADVILGHSLQTLYKLKPKNLDFKCGSCKGETVIFIILCCEVHGNIIHTLLIV